MKVRLNRAWFAPDGSRYEADVAVHDFPDNWEDQIPSSADILDDEGSVVVRIKTADNTVLLQEQAVDGKVKPKNLDGKASDDDKKGGETISLPGGATAQKP
jgi:hypothetical protein